MAWVFYIASGIALVASLLVVSARNAVHAALYLVVSLLAVALVFFSLGAPFVGALEIIVYAGAIMVMILFVVMLLNLGRAAEAQERAWLKPRIWLLPAVMCLALGAALIVLLAGGPGAPGGGPGVAPGQVARGLFGPYVLGVELASMLLLAGLVAAYHLTTAGRRSPEAARGPEP